MRRWIGSALVVVVIGAAAGCSGTNTGDETTASPSVTPTPSSPMASVTEGPTGATGTTGPTGSPTSGWTVEQEAQAVSIIADDIEHRFPLERRKAAGRCTVEALKTRDRFDSFDAWFAIWVQESDPDALLVAIGVLEDCKAQVGI
jgi:hypothetical protein